MKGLRIICIFALVALFLLGSMGTVFAKQGTPADSHGKSFQFQGEKRGFAGNVTDVDLVSGNVTLTLNDGGSVILLAGDEFRYKIPREINKWQQGNITDVLQAVDGDLIGRRAVVQAGNDTDTGDWLVLKFMVLPVPGTQPMHAHRTGLVTVFNKPTASIDGNITIIDVQGGNHTFIVGNNIVYHPKGTVADDITADLTPPYSNADFVTVVTTGDPKVNTTAKAIVLHASRPEVWPNP